MDIITLQDIKMDWQPESIADENRIKPGTRFRENFIRLLYTAEKVMQPRAVIRWVKVDGISGAATTIDKTVFQSKVMANKLKNAERVFISAMTAGNEVKYALDDKDATVANIIQNTILYKLHAYVTEYIHGNFHYEGLGFFSPGSLPDWPINNNKAVFSLLGSAEETLGITLNSYGYMDPPHSLSGIFFANNEGYQNCSLCKIYDCLSRRAPFDKKAYERIFGIEK